ncbi:hypothetical protein [Cyanobium sp. CH-040]|uniref:hypothetical protein n=1 Tax=Cyanobium sp. CH-040 TaxID=2823708 RepID=UPI0020CDB53D|nr:hypothetical protein [Cyanobium sp. CH-040]MCP9928557.1 hypothetical protein [Cyanobium sp. CH-040]
MPATTTRLNPHRPTPRPGIPAIRLPLLLAAGLALTGCNLKTGEALMRQGHQAMVECQHGERAITDGDELRCEDWEYVRSNYLERRRSDRQAP